MKKHKYVSFFLAVLLSFSAFLFIQPTQSFADEVLADGNYTISITATPDQTTNGLSTEATLKVSGGQITAGFTYSARTFTFKDSNGNTVSADAVPIASLDDTVVATYPGGGSQHEVQITFNKDTLVKVDDGEEEPPVNDAFGTFSIQIKGVTETGEEQYENTESLLHTAKLQISETETYAYITSTTDSYVFPNNEGSVYSTQTVNGEATTTYKVKVDSLSEKIETQYRSRYTFYIEFDEESKVKIDDGDLSVVPNPEEPEDPNEAIDAFNINTAAPILVKEDGEYTINVTGVSDLTTMAVHQQDSSLQKPVYLTVKDGVMTVTLKNSRPLTFTNQLTGTRVDREVVAESTDALKAYRFELESINQIMEVWFPAGGSAATGGRLSYNLVFDASSLTKLGTDDSTDDSTDDTTDDSTTDTTTDDSTTSTSTSTTDSSTGSSNTGTSTSTKPSGATKANGQTGTSTTKAATTSSKTTLPKTGEYPSKVLMIIGGLISISGVVFFVKNRFF